jgi:hypothetical protein
VCVTTLIVVNKQKYDHLLVPTGQNVICRGFVVKVRITVRVRIRVSFRVRIRVRFWG